MATLPHDTYASPGVPLWATANSPNGNLTTASLTLTSTPATTTGGVITQSGGYTFHTFTSSGTFTTSTPVFAQILVVGGGGSGGGGNGGGGGGAGEVNFLSSSLAGSSTIVIGNGGTSTPDGVNGTNGQSTTITGGITITALGGGGGASYDRGGLSGACGGGAGGGYSGSQAGGVGTQGFSGGNGYLGGYKSGGGGGVAGVGGSATSTTSGNGGIGRVYSVNGVSYSVGGGGGGGIIGGTNGVGVNGGGRGANDAGGNATAGTDGTGGGGGGGGYGATNGVGAGGGSGIVVISYLTNGTLVLTNQGGILAQNGVADIPTSQWSTTPAINNTIYMDANNTITNSGNNLYFNGSLIANASDISNIGDWAMYNANANVNLSNTGSNYNLSGAGNITAVGTITGNNLTITSNITGDKVIANTISNATNMSIVSGASSVGLLTNSFPQIRNLAYSTISNNIDRGVDVGGDAVYSIVAKNGRSGIITLQANSGDNNEASYGRITLTANGTQQVIGSVQYTYGGLLELYANTPIPTGGVVASSAVKINGAGVNIYAGSFNSFGSLAGQLYLWGQAGASLTSSGTAPSPIVAGSVYIYGSNGTKIDGLVQMSNLSNISGSGFTINGGGNSGSYISNFNAITAGTLGSTTGNFQNINASNISGYTAGTTLVLSTTAVGVIYPSITINSASNINLGTSNSGKVLYNGNEVLTSAVNWSTIPATQGANLSNFGMSNVGNLSNVNSVGNAGGTLTLTGTTISNLGTLDMNTNNINNAYGINSTSGLYLFGSNTASLSARSSATSGQVIINAGSNYHLITMSAGFGMSIVSSNSLLISSTSNTISGTTTISNTFNRVLGSNAIAQPITQYGNASGTGNNGNVAVTIPHAYTSSTSYNVFVTHTNSSPPNLSVVKNTASEFTIYWTSAGAGTQPFDWMTIGT